MNEYTYDEIKVGLQESFQREITQEMVDNFFLISEDNNPLHVDKEFAVQEGYKDKVVYGMLTASLFSKLGGVYLPGKYCLFYECDSKFNKPVFVGDLLTVSGKVIEKNENPSKNIVVKGIIKNQNNEIVCIAKLVFGVKR